MSFSPLFTGGGGAKDPELVLLLAKLTCIANLDLDFNHILSIQSKSICHVTGNYKMNIIGWWLDLDYLSFSSSL